ncbi:MAG: hypothetical protein Ct9H90mP4_11310 [Gammaproteobacteria bacterium]|nr:MAG: hypothetical protein Ct9H90mP4_11310 [Gammaproteobacteria bacterium]
MKNIVLHLKKAIIFTFTKKDGLQDQSVLYRRKDDKESEVFLDPNKFSKDGSDSLSGISFSTDGSLAAYSVSEDGSDWRKIYIIDTETKKQIEKNPLFDVKFSGISWKGNEGFFYSSYPKPKKGANYLRKQILIDCISIKPDQIKKMTKFTLVKKYKKKEDMWEVMLLKMIDI